MKDADERNMSQNTTGARKIDASIVIVRRRSAEFRWRARENERSDIGELLPLTSGNRYIQRRLRWETRL